MASLIVLAIPISRGSRASVESKGATSSNLPAYRKCINENPTRVFPVFTPVVRFQVDKCLMGFYKRQFPCEACYGHYPPSRDDEERGKTIENVCFRCYPESQYNCEEEHQGSSSGKR